MSGFLPWRGNPCGKKCCGCLCCDNMLATVRTGGFGTVADLDCAAGECEKLNRDWLFQFASGSSSKYGVYCITSATTGLAICENPNRLDFTATLTFIRRCGEIVGGVKVFERRIYFELFSGVTNSWLWSYVEQSHSAFLCQDLSRYKLQFEEGSGQDCTSEGDNPTAELL